MRLKKALPIIGLGLAAALTLAGCSSDPAPTKEIDKPSTSAPSETPSETEAPSDDKTPDPAKPGASTGATEVTYIGLGEKGEDGEYTHFPVVISVKVDSIDLISEAERASLYETATDEQKTRLDAFDYYKINYTETYVSGDDPAYQASYTSYDPVNASGTKLTSLALIGFDWCPANSFSKDFVNGTPQTSCLLGAVAKGDTAPAGIQFAQSGTATDAYDGTPIVILK